MMMPKDGVCGSTKPLTCICTSNGSNFWSSRPMQAASCGVDCITYVLSHQTDVPQGFSHRPRFRASRALVGNDVQRQTTALSLIYLYQNSTSASKSSVLSDVLPPDGARPLAS